jgi:pyruvate/2-oxoacid:ferredoxin oxidoreductase beta subunit
MRRILPDGDRSEFARKYVKKYGKNGKMYETAKELEDNYGYSVGQVYQTCPEWWRKKNGIYSGKKVAKKKVRKRVVANLDRKQITDDDVPDVPVPIGPKWRSFINKTGWIPRRAIDSGQWSDQSSESIGRTKLMKTVRGALKEVAAVVHKASNHTVYVGRTYPEPRGLRARFKHHIEEKGAIWIAAAVRCPLEKARDERWEGIMIRWAKMKARIGRLCCNNNVDSDIGRWPNSDEILIYVVACRRRVLN